VSEPKRNIPLQQPSDDKTARIMREKIGDTRTLANTPVEGEPIVTLAAADQKPLEQAIVAALRSIFDPEIPLNIYDLGLIYRLTIDATNAVRVEMTLTAPGCPVAGDIVAEVKRKIEAIAEVPAVQVDLVWDPPWTRERLSEAARLELGML